LLALLMPQGIIVLPQPASIASLHRKTHWVHHGHGGTTFPQLLLLTWHLAIKVGF